MFAQIPLEQPLTVPETMQLAPRSLEKVAQLWNQNRLVEIATK